jgi:hypothetical protein
MDNFEQYLQDQKEDLQLKEINPAIWEGILKEQPSARLRLLRRPYIRWLSVAAVLALVVGWSLFAPSQSSPPLSADLLEEFGFDHPTPNLIINAKLAELTAISIPEGYDEAYAFVLQEIKELDKRNAVILEEVKRISSGEFTQRQALRYYRKKVDLLNQLIEDLQKIQRNEKAYPAATSPI